MKTFARIAAVTLVAAAGSAASADVILTFGFNDLVGSYDNTTKQFAAVNGTTSSFSTSGDLTSFVGAGGTANYEPGFATGSIAVNIDVTNKVGNTADGAGSFSIVDADGTGVLTGDISGTWSTPGFGIYYFDGLLTNVQFANPATSFDGPSGGSFATFGGVYEGALVQLFTAGSGGFFSSDWRDVSVLVNGNIVPAPGAAALAGLAGLVGLRRRR